MSSTIYKPNSVVPSHDIYYVVVDKFGKQLHSGMMIELPRFPDFSELPCSEEIPSAYGYSPVQLLSNWEELS